MHRIVQFDSSAKYTSTESLNQWDQNKLFGFTEGWHVHEDSARFGWNWIEGTLCLSAYVYVNGERKVAPLTWIPLDEPVQCTIVVAPGKYIFIAMFERQGEIVVDTVEMPRRIRSRRAWGFRLYPYFGGNEVAPHDVKIRIDRV